MQSRLDLEVGGGYMTPVELSGHVGPGLIEDVNSERKV